MNQFYNSFWKPIEQEWTEKKVEESEEMQIEFLKKSMMSLSHSMERQM